MIDRPPGWRFVTHAIVSREGYIADRDGTMPDCLHVPEDQARFRAALASADVTIVGREGHERHPAGERRRVVLTSRIDGIARDGASVIWWNPERASLADALLALELPNGTAVIAGGTRVMTALLPITDRFDLVVAEGCTMADGRPCLVGAGSVEGVEAELGRAGLTRQSVEPLGTAILQVWQRL